MRMGEGKQGSKRPSSSEGYQGAVQKGFLEGVAFAQSLTGQQNLKAKTGEKAF